MSKDLWFAEYEKAFNEAEDDGSVNEEKIIALTERRYRDRLADMADHARLLKKEGRS